MEFTIETGLEVDGRWIAEIAQVPGALVYAETRQEAVTKVQALALRVLAERIEHGELSQEITEMFTVTTV